MASLTLFVPGPVPTGHRKVTITTVEGDLTWTVPLLRSFDMDNLAMRWSIQDRPGRAPVTIPAGQNAVQPRLVVAIGTDLTTSAENDLRYLRAFAIRGQAVVIGMGKLNTHSATGSWVITDMALSEIELQQGSNEIARAAATLTLTAAMTPFQVLTTGQ